MTITEKRSNASQSKILTSDWGHLSPHLIARFYPLKKMPSGSGWEQSRDKHELSAADKFTIDDGFEVHAPITDATTELTLNWQSPFEGAGAESKAPALTAMLQSGNLSPMLQAVMETTGFKADSVASVLDKATGRTGITKLNSTQIFSGMPPLKLSLTLHFRAWHDPITEVRNPIKQIQEWAVPQLLSSDGLVAGAIKGAGMQGFIETVFPSISPQVIGMRYGDRTYEPMVIESVSEIITAPRSETGVLVQQSIQITLSSLSALDRRDIGRMYRL
jgi:hypothetical protein